jgi:dTDP-4-dehydrorhamnose reductase
MIKTAVIGASGYIGAHLFRKYRETFADCIGTGFSRLSQGLTEFDLRNPEKTSLRLQETGHQAVIISSAMPNVGWCESHPTESYALNVQGTLKLAKLLASTPIKLYFMSSDYVFDGKTGGYTDQAKTCPVTEYGRQKAEVERELPNILDNYAILRLSKIYGTSWKDKTLIDDLASSLLKGQKLTVATDQFFSPTHVDDVVAMTLEVQNADARGVINLCHSQAYSRQQIAQKLVDALGVFPELLHSAKLHSIPGMENRPLNTSLICSPILEKLQSSLWTIDKAVQAVAANWSQNAVALEAAAS